ncbi:unnamed protein product [Lactuca saligna]|uniref:ATP-dependent DNA helicase n=1 Tax=Lactuca saligna TaxID=75948 RepID=A0AA35YVZ3_LACSI|nr:unnamed protein product [Lactuca saligna]
MLTQNMRLNSNENSNPQTMSTALFTEWLLQIGEGIVGQPDPDDPRDMSFIQIPHSLLIPPTHDSLQQLIHFVYGTKLVNAPTVIDLSTRAIVCPTNEAVDNINSMILKSFNTDSRTYNSTNAMEPNGKHTSDLEGSFPTEYLNQLTFPGIPPHTLELKLKTPIMIINEQRRITSIYELKRDVIGSAIELRIVQKWRHDVRRYETWFLGVDRFGDAIQILGQRTNQSYIESVVNVSECYTISEYSCPELDKYQKVLENDFYIDVGLSSVIKPLANTITIPTTWFCFASKSQLAKLGEHLPYYPYFIGMLSKIRDYTKHDGQPYVLILTDDRGNEVPINLWKECFTNPMKLNRILITPPPAMIVVAVTNLKPSVSAGTLRHGSSHATHMYVNPQIPETTELMNLYNGPHRPSTTPSGIPAKLKEIREKTRLELLVNLHNPQPKHNFTSVINTSNVGYIQEKTVLVKASIVDIVFQDKWCQMICPTSRDPIFRRGTQWYCSAHSKIEKPILTHKFHVTINDPTATISAIISETSFNS